MKTTENDNKYIIERVVVVVVVVVDSVYAVEYNEIICPHWILK